VGLRATASLGPRSARIVVMGVLDGRGRLRRSGTPQCGQATEAQAPRPSRVLSNLLGLLDH
jgi:hypothetical protein